MNTGLVFIFTYTLGAKLCIIGRIHNGLKVVVCFRHAVPPLSELDRGVEHMPWKIYRSYEIPVWYILSRVCLRCSELSRLHSLSYLQYMVFYVLTNFSFDECKKGCTLSYLLFGVRLCMPKWYAFCALLCSHLLLCLSTEDTWLLCIILHSGETQFRPYRGRPVTSQFEKCQPCLWWEVWRTPR